MKLPLLHLSLWLAAGAMVAAPWSALRAQTVQSSPNLTPKRPHHVASSESANDDTADSDQPIATVNGLAVYRPLMRSAVSSPVDRALLIFAYHKSGMGMSAHDKDITAEQFKLSQFGGSDQRLTAKLHALNATRDDYKHYAVEEAKIRDVLRNITRGARSPGQAQQQQSDYLAQLRRSASINTARP